jgi:hypothetical protein
VLILGGVALAGRRPAAAEVPAVAGAPSR